MGTVPSLYTWANGDRPYFSEMNARIQNTLNFLTNPPMVRLRKTAAQNMISSTDTAISWDLVEVESENMWDASQPTRIKPSTPGWYLGECGGSFDDSATGYRQMDVRKNNGTDRSIRVKSDGYTQVGATTVIRGVSFIEQFNGTTDYIEVLLFQNSGASMGVRTNLDEQPSLCLRWFAAL